MLNKNVKIAVAIIKGLAQEETDTIEASMMQRYQVARKLRKAGIISSQRGRTGGYFLEQSIVTLKDITDAVDTKYSTDKVELEMLEKLKEVVVYKRE